VLGASVVGAIMAWFVGALLGTAGVLALGRVLAPDVERGPFGTLSQLPPFLGAIIALLLYTRLVERRPAVSLGLQPLGATARWLRGAVVGALMMGVITLVWFTVVGGSSIRGNGDLERAVAGLVVAFIVFVVQGPSEELLFRGFIQQTVTRGWGVWWGVAVSAVLFGLLHGLNPNFAPLAAVNLILFGLAAALYKLLIDNSQLWGVFAIHTVWNWLQEFVFGLENSGTSTNPGNVLFQLLPDKSRPVWVWGGGFGPEGTLGATIVLALLIAACLLEGRARAGGVGAAMAAAEAQELETVRTRLSARRRGLRPSPSSASGSRG
jgi:uncharacterized protein